MILFINKEKSHASKCQRRRWGLHNNMLLSSSEDIPGDILRDIRTALTR